MCLLYDSSRVHLGFIIQRQQISIAINLWLSWKMYASEYYNILSFLLNCKRQRHCVHSLTWCRVNRYTHRIKRQGCSKFDRSELLDLNKLWSSLLFSCSPTVGYWIEFFVGQNLWVLHDMLDNCLICSIYFGKQGLSDTFFEIRVLNRSIIWSCRFWQI